MSGDAGDDLLFGNAGRDSITGNDGVDTIEGGAGKDDLYGGANAGDTVAYTGSHAGVTVRITYGSATIGKGGDARGDLIGGFTDAIGSAHNDRITDTVSGTVAYGGNDNTLTAAMAMTGLHSAAAMTRALEGMGRTTRSSAVLAMMC